jgi:N utilization substance protein B
MSEAREEALVTLYEAELARLPSPDMSGMSSKARRLVDGVVTNAAEIDAVLEEVSHNWRLSRMPAVDRCLLRVGAFELIHSDTPMAVVISEVVELAKRYSTERSGAFVNGVLAAVADATGK